MKKGIPAACLVILGLAGLLGTPSGAAAREARERLVRDQQTIFVYDRESDSFVRVQRRYGPANYRAGPIGVNVGYEPRLYGQEDLWSLTVQRFLIRRPFK